MSQFRLQEPVLRAVGSQLSATRALAQRARVIQTAEALRRRRALPASKAAWLAAAVVLLAMGALLTRPWSRSERAELSWQRATVRTAHWVGDRGLVEVEPGTTAEVAQRGRDVEAVLTAGSLYSKVERNRGTRWVVRSGEYRAEAVGTEFMVERSAARFHVAVIEGRVHVSGGALQASEIELLAGDMLTVSASGVQLVRAPPPPPEPLPPTESGTVADETDSTSLDAAEPSSGEAKAPTLAVTPRAPFDSAASAAAPVEPTVEPAGNEPEDSVRSLPCADLANAADRARLAPDPQRAERALREVRRRCPGSAEAARAAFLLGRMAEPSNPAAAIGLYTLYLSEAPGGTFAEQALGRRITVEQRAGRIDEARASARGYLSRFRDGSYALLARSLLLP